MAAIMRVRDENGNVVDVPIIVAPQGPDGGGSGGGTSGFSPVVEVSKSGKVTTLTIHDAEGTKTATIEDGADGISPRVEIQKTGKVTTLTITDAEGEHSVDINDGADGADGEDGTDGGSDSGNEQDIHIDISNWYSGSFEMTYENGTTKTGSVTFENGRPKTITLNGHTLTLTLPEVE